MNYRKKNKSKTQQSIKLPPNIKNTPVTPTRKKKIQMTKRVRPTSR